MRFPSDMVRLSADAVRGTWKEACDGWHFPNRPVFRVITERMPPCARPQGTRQLQSRSYLGMQKPHPQKGAVLSCLFLWESRAAQMSPFFSCAAHPIGHAETVPRFSAFPTIYSVLHFVQMPLLAYLSGKFSGKTLPNTYFHSL